MTMSAVAMSSPQSSEAKESDGHHAGHEEGHAPIEELVDPAAVPGAVARIERACAIARSAGVERLVLLSGRGEPEAQACERIVQESGLEWTVVRASWFFQNFSAIFG